ncbi:diguanylate cyclase (GGDEF) domain-containing protein [Frankia torreyi]|uniref:Diguanylate cyclase (GGDEF) domain-containing protein n=1 Tax=Frankia torreyi TaxID=1856 RepID=A0A0D8B9E5_9ACTN|nr:MULTISPECIES: GGDEF domain-containing protein [Frankia]KJE20564.1 diguanylate cyclase (GGDEF) domain-containing protein [Frankia torreyi]KQC39549.1 diguanylate cyclase [Frankia sp. ACN1ag]KQM02871.1 diguanylate cyclase (GGDEF) domain-containing protein [Frankia sp. CpI1-P]
MPTDDIAAAVFDSLPSPVAVLGPDGTVARLNEAWRRSAATGVALLPVRPGMSWLAACDHAAEAAARAAGTSVDQARSSPAGPVDLTAFDPVTPVRTLAFLSRQLIDRRRTWARIELPQPAPRGHRWLDVRLSALIRGDGLIVVVEDVTERRHREEDLRRQATTDPITGLANRTALRALLAARLTPSGSGASDATRARAGSAASSALTPPSPERAGTAVLFLDLDAFRRINNSFGYPTGDAALRAVARRFSSVLGAADVLGRWDGDEFVVLAGSGAAPDVADLAERLVAALDEPLDVHGHRIRLSVSVGVALVGAAPPHSGDNHPEQREQGRQPGNRGAAGAPTEDGDVLVARAGAEVTRARSRLRAGHDRRSRSGQ